MVHVLQKVDPENKYWQELQLNKAVKETEGAFALTDKKEREQKLIEINEAFDEKINDPDYARKLFLVENCIYGVDIQPIATQISKLRFFISLVVDQKVDKDKPNFGIRALPNLETKFVAANTLIGIDKPEAQMTLFDNQEIKELEQELKKVRHRLFSAKSPATKRRLRDKDKEIREKIGDLLVEHGWGNETAKQLAGWDPYDQNASSPFFDPEWMFDIKDGFDVVIGNPPYIEARNSKLFPEIFKKQYQHNVQLRWKAKSRYIPRGVDLLIYFFEFSLKQLKADGINTFITQNAWLSTDYGKKFQDFLLSLDLSIKIDDSNLKHFDSAGGPNINTVISFFKNEKVEKKINLSSVDISRSKGTKLVSDEKIYNFNDNILNYKWGTLLKSPDFILKLFRTITKNGSRKNYSIGQGLNITQAHFIKEAQINKITISPDILLPIMTSNDGAPFILTETAQYIVNPLKINASQRKEFNRKGIDVCKLSNRRYIPSLILPRGLGRYFAALNNISAYSASFVEVYVTGTTQLRNNIWLFLNSTIGYIIREITGRANLGGGMLKAEATDLKYFNLNHKFKNEIEIERVIESAINIESKTIDALLNLELHKKIDNIVFSHFGVENTERLLIIEYLKELVNKRENKSKT